LLNHIAGHDLYDGTSSAQPKPDFTAALGKDIKGMKIGVMYMEYPELQAVKAHYEHEFKVLEELGATIEYVKAMDPKYAISVYTVVQRGEVSSNLARYDGIRYGRDRSHMGSEAKRRIMLGTYTLSKGYADQYYNMAQKVRSLFIEDFQKLFNTYDVLIAPTTPSYAEKVGASAGQSMFGELMDALVEASSIAGLPGISVPCYHDTTTNLFLGLDIMAPMWREDLCIQVASAYERATTWNTWRSA
jgi:aspartyl-tRNA(Asn)/glutamyl-tRNA(Gln) amidotransferase subunit A